VSSRPLLCVADFNSTIADFITTNEGDARELGEEDDENYFSEEIRVEDLATVLGYDATKAPYNDDTLGRLKVGAYFQPASFSSEGVGNAP